MRRATVLRCALAVTAMLALAGLVRGASRADDGFPHATHERLFPVCQGCHGVLTHDDAKPSFPAPAACARCHDGTRAARVDWQAPAVRASNLRFLHAQHPSATDGANLTCQTCHAAPGAGGRMAVGRATPELCIGCHEHRASDHLADVVECSSCHVPLAAAPEIATGRIAQFPQPAWHGAADFISTHGTSTAPVDASCTVCHARDSCERCHANADRLPRVQALARDARVAALVAGRAPAYPVPSSHAADWHFEHGASARAGIDSCANCHTRPSCTGCHAGGMGAGGTGAGGMGGSGTGAAAAAVRALPPLVSGAAPGVDPARITRTVHAADVKRQHGGMAATGQLDCAQCHTREQCTSCHAAADSRSFHATNFVERHAADVFAGRGECQACHSTETFCRACHTRVGVAAATMNASFHDAQPMWILSHGQAARRGLDACASCHRQNDCVQCHSATGGWGVNPHGPGFTGRGATRSAASCRLCHRTSPAGGG